MRTLHNPQVFYALDPQLERTYREAAQKYYRFTPSMSFRKLMRSTQLKRLDSVIGMDINFPHLALSRTSWQYRTNPLHSNIRYVSIDMVVEWGGNWGFCAMTSQSAVKRLVRAYMADQHPQAKLVKMWCNLAVPNSEYYPNYPAVKSVEICYES